MEKHGDVADMRDAYCALAGFGGGITGFPGLDTVEEFTVFVAAAQAQSDPVCGRDGSVLAEDGRRDEVGCGCDTCRRGSRLPEDSSALYPCMAFHFHSPYFLRNIFLSII